VNAATARNLGIDLHTTEGNIAFTRYLYDKVSNLLQ